MHSTPHPQPTPHAETGSLFLLISPALKEKQLTYAKYIIFCPIRVDPVTASYLLPNLVANLGERACDCKSVKCKPRAVRVGLFWRSVTESFLLRENRFGEPLPKSPTRFAFFVSAVALKYACEHWDAHGYSHEDMWMGLREKGRSCLVNRQTYNTCVHTITIIKETNFS